MYNKAVDDYCKNLKVIYDSVIVGNGYDFHLGGTYSDFVWRVKRYKVLDKMIYRDRVFRFLCQSEDKGVIYHWLVPKWNDSLSEKIINITGYQTEKV